MKPTVSFLLLVTTGSSAAARILALICGLTAIIVPRAQSGETVLHSFAYAEGGTSPRAGVIRDPAANLYGTTQFGGVYGSGVIYEIDTSGHEHILHSFIGSDGANPSANVTLDAAGNLYGTTENGGAFGFGVAYKFGRSAGLTVLHNFAGGVDGAYPVTSLIFDESGTLYGTTTFGGSTNCGTVFSIDSSGTEEVLYSFAGSSDGCTPEASVVRDSKGNLYGTTLVGGASSAGTVYELDPSGHETVLHTFTGGADGSEPAAALILDAAGNLYGTTSFGGSSRLGHPGNGVAFRITPSGNETVLHVFTGQPDGSDPQASLVGDGAGNLYGTTASGGSSNGGSVFKIDVSGHETVLYNFSSTGSFSPLAGVILDPSGNLYGTTSTGESYQYEFGSVFQLSAGGQETDIHNFSKGAGIGGADPAAGLIRDSSGNFYGSTAGGGAGGGVVFKLNPSGQETVLYNFTGGADGEMPTGSLILDSNGSIYGTTQSGGSGLRGVIFRIDASGQETVLYSFTGGDDGSNPQGGVVRDSEGNLYGTAPGAGAFGFGTVFKLNTSGTLTVLHAFTGGADGAQPNPGLILDAEGNLYGTTLNGGNIGGWGAVFKIDTNGNETVLYQFTDTLGDGQNPSSGVTMDSQGNLYGTTQFGGSTGVFGTIYKLSLSGAETILHSFAGGTDGAFPFTGVTLDSAGSLYGTTATGGTSFKGAVYKLSPDGQETTLHSFTGPDGETPYAGVLVGPTGGIYGTTYSGGRANAGVIFAVVP